MATIKGVSIKKDDIVKVKFKPLDEILAIYQKEDYFPSRFLDDSDIDQNLSAVLEGGFFKVSDVYVGEDDRYFPQLKSDAKGNTADMPHEIEIDNYLNGMNEFTFNEYIVDEISIEHDVAETYFSNKFKVNIMKLNGALYVNNELVTKDDAGLVKILESAISDLAIQNMLSDSE